MSSTITYEIAQYKVLLCSRHTAWTSSYGYQAVITLYDAEAAVASLRFPKSVGNKQDYYYTTRNGLNYLNLFYDLADFDRVLSLLQTEKPVYVHLRKGQETSSSLKPGLGSLSTDAEPVGEEES